MYTKLKAVRISRLAIICLAAMVPFYELSRIKDANAEKPSQTGQSDLYDGTQKLIPPERPRETNGIERTEIRIERQSTELLRKAIGLPQEIPVPRDLRMHEENGERLVFPKHEYEQMYLQGWNECLYVIGNTNAPVDGDIMSSCLSSFNNNWESGAGLVAGFQDCQKRMMTLSKIYNLELIRNLAKELHRAFPNGVAWERKTFMGDNEKQDRQNIIKEEAPKK
jgi:hypothetical protein